MARIEGQCCICGAIGPLSFEHVPPAAAFNDHGVLYGDLVHHFSLPSGLRDPNRMRRRKSRRGAGRHTLCERCNRLTGGFYGNSYVSWAVQGMEFRFAAPLGSSLLLPFHILPGRVAKQIICMFASACGPGLFEKSTDLRRYVLNRDHTGIPRQFRLYGFLISQRSNTSRQAGITGLLIGRSSHVFAEISFPPFGYILTIDSAPQDTELADLTFLTQFGFKEFRTLHLRLPVREINSYFPADFRPREEWDAAISKARQIRSDDEEID